MNYCHQICELLEIRGGGVQNPPSYGPDFIVDFP